MYHLYFNKAVKKEKNRFFRHPLGISAFPHLLEKKGRVGEKNKKWPVGSYICRAMSELETDLGILSDK